MPHCTRYIILSSLELWPSNHYVQQLPHRKQVVTRERPQELRKREQNPFEADEDNEEEESPTRGHRHSQSQSSRSATPTQPTSLFGSQPSSTATMKSKKEKDKKGGKKKSKPFNLEAEKPVLKNCIAESSVASTNLLNALRLINRENERISENQAAVGYFETCKLLRRKILRYVS